METKNVAGSCLDKTRSMNVNILSNPLYLLFKLVFLCAICIYLSSGYSSTCVQIIRIYLKY